MNSSQASIELLSHRLLDMIPDISSDLCFAATKTKEAQLDRVVKTIVLPINRKVK